MNQFSRLIPAVLLSGCFFLQGCSSVKKSLGIDRDPPDEFSVVPSIQPLDMPPDFFSLPIPQPGVARPQDVKAIRANTEKILGPAQVQSAATPGQKALLEIAGINETDHDIRQKVDGESKIVSAQGKPILERLGIKSSSPKGSVVNPYEESLELEKQGITTSKPSAVQ